MKELTYTLPWPPTVNHYWRSVTIGGQRRTLLSKEGRLYKRSVAATITAQRRAPSAPLAGHMAVAITLFPPDRRRYDLDNRLKAILDSLTDAGVWCDDSQVKLLHVEEGERVKGGACVVRISPAPASQVPLLDAYGQGGE